MRAGDKVRFRSNSHAWRARGLAATSRGIVMELYRVPPHGDIKADVRFGVAVIERGLDVNELETDREGMSADRAKSAVA